jgi:hypothetical protein
MLFFFFSWNLLLESNAAQEEDERRRNINQHVDPQDNSAIRQPKKKGTKQNTRAKSRV